MQQESDAVQVLNYPRHIQSLLHELLGVLEDLCRHIYQSVLVAVRRVDLVSPLLLAAKQIIHECLWFLPDAVHLGDE